ncbi:MAG: zinc ribbon domain-containing protein [Oscillibacter sp.]
MVFCADCKQKLYYSTTNYFEKRQDFFICSTHRANKDKCSGHYIRAVVLEQIGLEAHSRGHIGSDSL